MHTLANENEVMPRYTLLEHHYKAARYHEDAAKHHREAAKHYESGYPCSAAHPAMIAHGNAVQALEHGTEAIKKYAASRQAMTE